MEKSEQIRAFLGTFERVHPTDDPLCAYLVRKTNEGVFAVENVYVRLENGKICDIRY
jgi:hypothetical protein